IMMPGLSGYDVLERLRADVKLRHIPVIMISAVDEIESVIRCIELGAEDYAETVQPDALAHACRREPREEAAARRHRAPPRPDRERIEAGARDPALDGAARLSFLAGRD